MAFRLSQEEKLLFLTSLLFIIFIFIFSFFSVLGFELWAYTFSHSTSPTFVMGFLR
jgi:hypothetical protein